MLVEYCGMKKGGMKVKLRFFLRNILWDNGFNKKNKY